MERPVSLNWCALALLALSLTTAEAQNLVVPQIADGGGWQTTLVLTNTSSSPASVSIAFFQDTVSGNTQSWDLPLLETGSTGNISLPAAGTVFLHSAASASSTTSGWAQIQTNSSVSAYAIFTLRVSGRSDQDGTSPAGASSNRVLIPYDNTGGHVTSVAVVNPTSTAETVTVGIQPTSGTSLQPTSIMLPAQGHMAFTMPQQFSTTAGQSGLLELNSANGSVAGVALRSNATGGLTTAPVYQESGPAIIGGGSSGTGALPLFTEIDIAATPTPDPINSPGPDLQISLYGSQTGYAVGDVVGFGGAGTLASPTLVYSAQFTSIAINGQTFSFNGLVVVGSLMSYYIFPGSDNITSGSVTLTLTPQVVATSGIVSGSLTLTSTLGTVNQTFTGRYTARP
jgi:hypothetical protein